MKIHMKIFLITFNILIFSSLSFGTINSLNLDAISAKQLAMGEVSVGITGDLNSIAVNPAGLNMLNAPQLSFMYYLAFENNGYFSVSIGSPLPKKYGSLGVSFIDFRTEPFKGFDEWGNNFSEDLGMSDYVFIIGYANNPLQILGIEQNLNLGINLKLGSSKIHTISKNFTAIDLGALYGLEFNGLINKSQKDSINIGVVIQNLGSDITYVNEPTELPKKYKLGIGLSTSFSKQINFNTGIDYISEVNNESSINCGAEIEVMKLFALRVGYKINERELDSFTLGVGGFVTISKLSINLNYALLPAGDLGINHSISVDVRF